MTDDKNLQQGNELQLQEESLPHFQSAIAEAHSDTSSSSNNVAAICDTFCVKYNETDPLKNIIHEMNDSIFINDQLHFPLIALPDHIIFNSIQSSRDRGANKSKRIKSESPRSVEDGNSTGGRKTNNKDKDRVRTAWSEEEKQALLSGYKKHATRYDKWRKIQCDEEFGHILRGRTNVDLKDKYRNISLTATRAPGTSSASSIEEKVQESQEPPLPQSSDNNTTGECKRAKGGEMPWTEEEKTALLQGYQRHGASSSKWMKIKHDPDFAEILTRRSNVDLKDKFRNIQLSISRSFKKEKEELGPLGHDYGILAGDVSEMVLIEPSGYNIPRELMNEGTLELMSEQPSSTGIVESAMEMSGFPMLSEHFPSQQQQQHVMPDSFQQLLEYTHNQHHLHQQHQHQQNHFQQQQQRQLLKMQLQQQDFLRENGMTDQLVLQSMLGDSAHNQLLSESVMLLPGSGPFAAIEHLHPMPLLPQQNNNVGKGRKKKEATATAAATTEPQQKRKRGRPPIQRILKPTAAVVPADPVEEPPTNLAADPSEVVQGGDRGEGWMH